MVGSRKILLVEDNLELRTIYEHYLRRRGYDIASAVDGEEGLSMAKQLRPGLIFLDIMMPKIDGLKLLKLSLIHI